MLELEGAADREGLRCARELEGSREGIAPGVTWRRRGEALLALVLLPPRVGGVGRAARLVGARERDYRRWLAAARAWLSAWAFDPLRDELRSGRALPSVPRDDGVRARLLVLLERVLRAGGAA